jgi:hypothetical protein
MKYDRLASALAATALTVCAAPALAATITLNDISVKVSEGVTLTLPTIEVTDSNLDEATLRNLFTGGLENAASSLATLDAAKVVIPELSLITTIPSPTPGGQPLTSTTVYRDFELTGVADGVAASTRLGALQSDSTDGTTFTTGEMTTGLLDLGGIFGFYGFGGNSADGAMRPIYRDLVIRDMKLAGPGFQCDIGDATGAEFSARPLEVTFTELMKVAAELEAAETQGTPPSTEAITTFINYYLDLFTAFQSTPTMVAGLECNARSETGNPLTATIGPITIGGFEPGIYPDFVLENFRIDVPAEGHFSLGSFTWKPMDFGPTIEGLSGMQDAIDLAWLEKNWRRLIPAIEGFAFSGLDFDVPGDASDERVVASIGGFDLSLADYVNGLPARVSTTASDIRIPLPESGEGSELRAFGFDRLDLDSEVSLHWDEASKSILVDNIELAGTDMGRISVSGIVGNAVPELFSPDTQVQTAAALGLTVRAITIDIENQGLAPTLIAMMAAEQKVPPTDFHVALSGMAQALPLGILGATPEALGLSQALGSFLAGTPQLTLTLTSVNPAGISLAEFMAAQNDPAQLKGKVTIAATASGEPVPFTWPEPTEPATPSNLTPDPKANS